MTPFTPYQRQHLFLLVGGNTLPNYVSAKLLAVPQGRIYLIYSSGTQTQALNLQDQLDREAYHVIPLSLQDGDADAYKIRGLVLQVLQQIPRTETLALNYTGGTKAMAVHAYIVLGYAQRNTLFTYLNHRDRAMMIERANQEAIRVPITVQDISIPLETLFGLHNSHLLDPPLTQGDWPDITAALVQSHQSKSAQSEWRQWFYSSCNRDQYDTCCFHPKLSLATMPTAIATSLHQIIGASPDAITAEQLRQLLNFSTVQALTDWFHGFWLEHEVINCIHSLAEPFQINDVGRNFQVSIAGTYRDRGFEFDVAFTRGYQLYAISCTTSENRKRCKQKLFEAAHRARQMGGSEAKVALVCCNLFPKSLEAELSTLPNPVKVKVLSLKARSLVEQIHHWISDGTSSG